MGIPVTPLRHQDETAHRQVMAERINQIRDFSFDDSRVRTGAEIDAQVMPVNLTYREGCLNRYATNTIPGTTDMLPAFTAALAVAAQYPQGGEVYGLNQVYATSNSIVVSATQPPFRFWCDKGGTITALHNNDGIFDVALNENYSRHIYDTWVITGPNTFLPAGGYTPPSTGAAINMNRNATTNVNCNYNGELRNLTLQGFKYGLNLQCVQQMNVYNSEIRFNQYGVLIDGGATNVNTFFGTNIYYNRVAGIWSTGRTGGSLTNATLNRFYGCLIQSNIPYPFAAGGTPPTDSMGIYLNNSYDFLFDGCYSENHSAAIYLTNSSSGNKFLNHRIASNPGQSRYDQIVLDGVVSGNVFDVKATPVSATEVNVVVNNAGALYNTFSGEGLNFIAGSVLAQLEFGAIRPATTYASPQSYGLIRMPSYGYAANVSSGTDPGQVNGIGTATATLNAQGFGEIYFGNGITADTTITSITGLQKHQLLFLASSSSAFKVTIKTDGLFGFYSTINQKDLVLTTAGQSALFYYTGQQSLVEIGRNFAGYKVSPSQDTNIPQSAFGIYQGTGVPNNANGNNGDIYLRGDTPATANQRIYIRSAGAWVGIL